jgi:hypothetical protein
MLKTGQLTGTNRSNFDGLMDQALDTRRGRARKSAR